MHDIGGILNKWRLVQNNSLVIQEATLFVQDKDEVNRLYGTINKEMCAAEILQSLPEDLGLYRAHSAFVQAGPSVAFWKSSDRVVVSGEISVHPWVSGVDVIGRNKVSLTWSNARLPASFAMETSRSVEIVPLPDPTGTQCILTPPGLDLKDCTFQLRCTDAGSGLKVPIGPMVYLGDSFHGNVLGDATRDNVLNVSLFFRAGTHDTGFIPPLAIVFGELPPLGV